MIHVWVSTKRFSGIAYLTYSGVVKKVLLDIAFWVKSKMAAICAKLNNKLI